MRVYLWLVACETNNVRNRTDVEDLPGERTNFLSELFFRFCLRVTRVKSPHVIHDHLRERGKVSHIAILMLKLSGGNPRRPRYALKRETSLESSEYLFASDIVQLYCLSVVEISRESYLFIIYIHYTTLIQHFVSFTSNSELMNKTIFN